jgi:hypothetical protein
MYMSISTNKKEESTLAYLQVGTAYSGLTLSVFACLLGSWGLLWGTRAPEIVKWVRFKGITSGLIGILCFFAWDVHGLRSLVGFGEKKITYDTIAAPTVDVEAARSRACDTAVPVRDRVQALRDLRAAEKTVAGARSRAVVASMLALLESVPEGDLRADICRQLNKAVPVDLRGPLLKALQSDPDETVREEAAETLGSLREVPEVRAELERAGKEDSSLKVRAQALRSLSDR